ncbi:MAG: pseudouridine synthase [Phocaeicola sp.]|uniref:pseudouridine synthase n=1 Tax=Phocaeicola TaxID=909656 RepID=UPI00234FB595|nr:pseudouridine synthase [Phocaeicola oris]MCE2616334.1 pseudouridine synthase [Phocaeicola oris]
MAFHPLYTEIPKPERFTFPFCYTPHPLSVMAAEELQTYIASVKVWQEEIAKGKMFGVLVVENQQGELGYLAAYSGILSNRNDWEYFVPPVYDLLRPGSYFQVHEAEISQLNKAVAEKEREDAYLKMKGWLNKQKEEVYQRIVSYRQQMKIAKQQRDELRKHLLTPEQKAELIKESQFMKAELCRMRKHFEHVITQKEKELAIFTDAINALKKERKEKSDALQRWLFSRFVMLNARGEKKDLLNIFATTSQRIPPAGSGECCAPKLLQYAYLHHYRPVCMAEFWWGASSKEEIRHHLRYYPACRGKCLPILTFMTQGLSVDPNPLEEKVSLELPILYEDNFLIVVNKPSGMLSVPGKSQMPSVYSIIKERCPAAEESLIVHRLDMATSGVMLLTKTKEAHEQLQKQFKERTIHKEYVALLDGVIKQTHGIISLPICSDPLNRPYQVVDFQKGKSAVTDYQVIDIKDCATRVCLVPHTGRTHQLRVHCASSYGLNCPIKGDSLYGKPADRLYLHAEKLTFTHPKTGERMELTAEVPF